VGDELYAVGWGGYNFSSIETAGIEKLSKVSGRWKMVTMVEGKGSGRVQLL
jgi:hypothetical protein